MLCLVLVLFFAENPARVLHVTARLPGLYFARVLRFRRTDSDQVTRTDVARTDTTRTAVRIFNISWWCNSYTPFGQLR